VMILIVVEKQTNKQAVDSSTRNGNKKGNTTRKESTRNKA